MRRAVLGITIGLLVALLGAGCATFSDPWWGITPAQRQPGSAPATEAASVISVQADPRTLPRWNPASIRQEAAIRFPGSDGNGVMTNYGGAGVGVSEDGTKLYASCMQALANGADQRRGQIVTWTLPAPGGLASVAMPCRGLTMAQLGSVHPDPAAYKPMMGGILEVGGRLLVSAFITYDAGAPATRTFFSGPSLTTLQGPYAPPSGVKTGIVKNAMGRIPPEWQSLLGGTAFATAGYSSIVGRASYGESFVVFNPEDVTRDGFPMTVLMACPVEQTKCRDRYQRGAPFGPPNLLQYGGSELQGGAMIIPGTRTLAYIIREAKGPDCYGYATRDQALHGTPYPTAANPSPEKVPWCWSMSDPLNEKGPKGYPYTLGARLYDLDDLVEVNLGRKAPHDVDPYAFVELPGVGPNVTLGYAGGGAFDEARGLWYQTGEFWPGAGDVATVPVYSGFTAGSQPPPPPPTPAWTAPLGLPTPTFGIAEVAPVEPSPWTAAVGGFYFVCPTCSGATDTGNPNGYPARPRVSLPNPIPAGSSVRLKGRLDGVTMITASGTSAAPVFVRGLPDDRPTLTREVETRGSSYLILEHLLFADRNGSEAGRLIIPGWSGAADHVVIRDSELTGNQQRAGGLFVLGGTHHVVYRNRLHDMGNLNDTGDQDSHCMAIGGTTSEIWVVDNELARCSGDGLQINAGFNNNALTHHLYIGRNFAHHNKQTGIWAKNASDVILSQNRFEDTVPSSSSTGACSGAQYGPQRVWWLFNTFQRCSWGISIQSTSGLGDGTNAYMVGNRMIGAMERAVSLWPDSVRSVMVVNNTADASPLHLETRTATHVVENNIASAVLWPNGQGSSTARANVTPGQPTQDVGVVSTVYAEFQQRYGRSIAVDANGLTRPQGAAWDIGAIEGEGVTPPTPVDCVVAWGPYVRVPGSESACVNSQRTYRAERTYTIVTPPEHGGAACPAQPERQVPDPTEACTMPPPPPSVRASVTTAQCFLKGDATNIVPPAGTGWRLRFQRRLDGASAWTNHGDLLPVVPTSTYEMERQVPLGRWEMQAVWTKTGQPSQPVMLLSVTECRRLP